MSEKLENLVTALDELTLLEAAELSRMLQEKWGVSAMAPVAMAATPGVAAGGEAAAEEEKTEFAVILKDVGPKKIQVIKAVRQLRSDLGLKEAKELVDGAPVTILESVPKEEAEAARGKLEAEGAVIAVE